MRPDQLKPHIDSKHNKKYRAECNQCGKSFPSRHYLETLHMLEHTGEKPHSCNFCGKSFNRKTNLNQHKKWHSGQDMRREKKHICENCGTGFTTTQILRNHLGQYNQITTFKCNQCNQPFSGKCNLNIHLKSH